MDAIVVFMRVCNQSHTYSLVTYLRERSKLVLKNNILLYAFRIQLNVYQ